MVVEYRDGQTALVLPVPDAEHIVEHWRERFDPSAACGMPAHITVLFLFLALGSVGSGELDSLHRLCDAEALPVQFAAFGSFPQVLYHSPNLRPTGRADVERGAALAGGSAVCGALAEVVRHLTVAMSIDAAVAEDIQAEARCAAAPFK